MKRVALLLGLLGSVGRTAGGALELTEANYDAETKGKYVFLKFYAPWCGHCKALRPKWSILAARFRNNATALVAQVDCTSEGGLPLCIREEVKAYPTLKWGDPADLQLYEYDRTSEAFLDFTNLVMKPTCSVSFLHLCDREKRLEVLPYKMMPADDLKKTFLEELSSAGSEGEDLEEERARWEKMPAERLKASFINSILWSDDDDEEEEAAAGEAAAGAAASETPEEPETPEAPEEAEAPETPEEAVAPEGAEAPQAPEAEATETPQAVGMGEL